MKILVECIFGNKLGKYFPHLLVFVREAESFDSKFGNLLVAVYLMNPFVDDSGCHSKLPCSPNNSPFS